MTNEQYTELSERLDRIENLLALASLEPREGHPTMDASEAAAYLRMDRNTVYRWAREGRIPHVKVGSRYYFYKTELDDWMREV